MSTTLSLHPSIDNGITPGAPDFSGGKLHCHCAKDPVEVTLASNVLHNHACGCSKCWKPKGALFSIVAVVPRKDLAVTAHGEKLSIVDESATIQRHACTGCGVHLFGRIEKEHPFHGLDFVHVELSDEKGWQEPQFAGFVKSVVDNKEIPEERLGEVKEKFKALGLETYEALSTELEKVIDKWTKEKKKAEEQAKAGL